MLKCCLFLPLFFSATLLNAECRHTIMIENKKSTLKAKQQRLLTP